MRPFAETGLVALDLANTLDPFLDDPERLPDAAALARFLGELGVDGTPGEHDVAGVRRLRGELRDLLGLPADAALPRVRALLDSAGPRLALVERDGGWAIAAAAPPRASLRDRLALRAVEELVAISRAPGLERVGRCAAAPCTDAYLDVTRNASRRFCSDRCSNRDHARRHRARSRGDTASRA